MRDVFISLALLSLVGCSAGYETYVSDARDAGCYAYERNTVRYTGKDLIIEAAYLPPDALDLYFSLFRGGRYENPFPPKSYMVYSLSIENTGKKDLTVNPRKTFLFPDKGFMRSAEDYSSFYSDLSIAGADRLDERVGAFKSSGFDGVEPIRPGGSRQMLVAFPRDKDMTDKAVLVVDLYNGFEDTAVPFAFGGGYR